ncbi:hypothetical protein [Nitrosospira multiformis]|nr:hypothetical protein [Nitrosospira multiformis]
MLLTLMFLLLSLQLLLLELLVLSGIFLALLSLTFEYLLMFLSILPRMLEFISLSRGFGTQGKQQDRKKSAHYYIAICLVRMVMTAFKLF